VVILTALLAPWLSLPIRRLAIIQWWAAAEPRAAWPGDPDILHVFLGSVAAAMWSPLIVGIGAVLARGKRRFRALAYYTLIAGVLATNIILGIRWYGGTDAAPRTPPASEYEIPQ